MAKAARLDSFVAQRGVRDCVIASLATVTKRSYEEIAETLKIPIDSTTRLPEIGDGFDLLDAIYPLLTISWIAAPLLASENPSMQGTPRKRWLATNEQIKAALGGRMAVVGYTDSDPLVGEHTLAWVGDHAIDCSDGTIVSLDTITINFALLLTPLR